MWEKIVCKVIGGRYVFTVFCAIAFLYCVINKVLAPADIKEIIMYVIIFYFATKERGQPKGGV
jgi:hypothetical protein